MPTEAMATGTVTLLRPNRDDGRGFGVIAPDSGGGQIAFDNRSLEGTLERLARARRGRAGPGRGPGRPLDRLTVGQRVRFRLGEHPGQPHRPYAARVRPLDVEAGTGRDERRVPHGAPHRVAGVPRRGVAAASTDEGG